MSLHEELVRHYRWLRQYGYNDSHSGNASVRVAGQIWITPTGSCADTLTAYDFVACDLEGDCLPGASRDADLHRQVYLKNDSARAVLHGHCPHAVALTLNGEDFVPLDFEGLAYFGRVKVLDIPYERYLDQAPAAVSDVLAEHPIAIVRGHGVYAQANSINQAYKWICSLELSAQTAFIARQAGVVA